MTGYTEELMMQGQTFYDFMTALIKGWECRDTFDTSYHEESLEEEKRELEILRGMTEEERFAYGVKNKAEVEAQAEKARESIARENKRLDDMIAQVQEWVPPTSEHDKVKVFALDQLESSKRTFSIYDDIDGLTPMDYFNEHLTMRLDGIAYHERRIAELRKHKEEHEKWYEQLLNNLEGFKTETTG